MVENVISVLLMGLDVEQYPPFGITLFDSVYERTGYDKPERSADEANLYEHALGFLDRFTKEAAGWRSRESTGNGRIHTQSRHSAEHLASFLRSPSSVKTLRVAQLSGLQTAGTGHPFCLSSRFLFL